MAQINIIAENQEYAEKLAAILRLEIARKHYIESPDFIRIGNKRIRWNGRPLGVPWDDGTKSDAEMRKLCPEIYG